MWKPIILVFASMALSLLPARGESQKTTNDLQNGKRGTPTTSGLETQTPQEPTTTNLGGQTPTQPTTNNLQQPPKLDTSKPLTR